MGKLVALLAVAVLGCGGDDREGVPIDDFATELAQITCAQYAECCTPMEFMEQTLGAETEEECRAVIGGFSSLFTNVYKDSITAGRLVYSPERMADCLDKLAAQTCADVASQRDDEFATLGCASPFEAQVALGGPCATSADCLSGWCRGDSIDLEGNITYGTCEDAPTVGMPCDDFQCTADGYCESGTCLAQKADGMACGANDECLAEHCNESGVCGVRMVCDGQ